MSSITTMFALAVLTMSCLLWPTSGLAAGDASLDAQAEIDLGIALLEEGDAANARTAFESAVRIEPGNAKALHGVAVSHLLQNDPTRALTYLVRAARADQADPRIVINIAKVQFDRGDAARAARTLGDLLLRLRNEGSDERVLDALSAALEQIEGRSRRSRNYQQLLETRDRHIARLEAARPGWRKWGVYWLRAADYQLIDERNREVQSRIDDAERVVRQAREQLVLLEAAHHELVRRAASGFVDRFAVEESENRVHDAQRDVRRGERQVESARNERMLPPWPAGIEMSAINAPVDPVGDEPPADRVAGLDQLLVLADGIAAADRPPAAMTIERFAAAFAISPSHLVTSLLAVDGASELAVLGTDGVRHPARLVRTDQASELALLEVTDVELVPVPLGERPLAGAATSVSFPEMNLFAPRAAEVPAMLIGPAAELHMTTSPRLGGGPLVADAKVVGMVLVDRYELDPPVRLIDVQTIRAFVAQHVSADASAPTDWRDAVVLVHAVHPIKQ